MSIVRVFGALGIALGLILSSVSVAGEGMINAGAVPPYRPKYFPFAGGEKEIYHASWNGLIAVATAEVHTVPAIVDGKEVFQVRVKARTSKALDLIWKMRDTISSTFDAKALLPSRFTFQQRENSRVIDTEARFDPARKRWEVNRHQAGKRPRVYHFETSNTLDPITAVYLARSTEFKVGDKLYFKVFGGRNQYILELFVEKREPVTLASGQTVEAYRIVPRIQNITKKGYADRLNEAAVWISADERRLPIKLSSKIAFGTVHMEVANYQETAQTVSRALKPAS